MQSWSDFSKKLTVAAVNTSFKVTLVQNVLLTTAIDLLGDLIFGLQKSQDQISTALGRIEKELFGQTITHFKSALRHLKGVPATKSSSQRKILVTTQVIWNEGRMG